MASVFMVSEVNHKHFETQKWALRLKRLGTTGLNYKCIYVSYIFVTNTIIITVFKLQELNKSTEKRRFHVCIS